MPVYQTTSIAHWRCGAACLCTIYVPALQWVFRMEPIMPMEWLRIVLISVTVVVAVVLDGRLSLEGATAQT